MTVLEKIKLIMLPGIASDERLMAAQQSRFDELTVPRWLSASESIQDPKGFAKHCWDTWTAGNGPLSDGRPYIIGGTSVGGIVATEIAWHASELGRPPCAVLLIGSCRSWQAVPRWYGRWAGWSNTLPKWIASKLLFRRHVTQSLQSDGADEKTHQLVEAMYQSADWGQLQLQAQLMAAWRRGDSEADNAPFPIHQLHGRLDSLLPKPSPKHATLLLDAGHWMMATHPDAVGNWIEAILRDSALKLAKQNPVKKT